MSTRSCIAKPDGDGWKGRYHHSDGYPSGLGRFLFEVHGSHFGGNTEAMIKLLIEDEPVGWSSIIDNDLSLPKSYLGYGERPLVPADKARYPNETDYSAMGPQSFSARGDTSDNPDGDWISSADGPDIMIEWVYVLTPGGLMVIDGGHGFCGLILWSDPDGADKVAALENEGED